MYYMLFLIEVIKKVWGVHFKDIIYEINIISKVLVRYVELNS